MNRFAILVYILSILSLISCEKVIDVELKDATPVLVIEANVSDQESSHYVYLSNTVSFSANGTANPVSGAKISIKELKVDSLKEAYFSFFPAKAERYFTEISPGIYKINNYNAYPGRKYTLTVVVNSQTYAASSIMPFPVAIDSVGTVTNSLLGDQDKNVALVYQDPPNEKNYYRYLMTVNGVLSKRIFVYNDKYNDGKKIQRDLFDDDIIFEKGDEVRIEQQQIDETVYRYFNGIRANNPGAAAPTNPISNFSNNALGYFSAYSVSRASARID